MTRGYLKRSLLRVGAAAVIVEGILLAPSPASAAYITVYGAPGYVQGVGGYSGGDISFSLNGIDTLFFFRNRGIVGGVNDAGTAVSFAMKINGAGENVGGAALRWNASGGAELGSLGVSYYTGLPNSGAYAINNAGTAVGFSTKAVASGPPKGLGFSAVRWPASGTAPTELDALTTDGRTESQAYAINEGGVAVGYSYKLFAGSLAVRWDASGTTPTELGHLGTNEDGYASAAASAVNDAGAAIGYSTKFDRSGRSIGRYAVRWDATGVAATELGHVGTLPPYDSFYQIPPTAAYAINNAGTAVGYSLELVAGETFSRPVRWDATSTAPTVLPLPLYGNPVQINDAGIAVGEGPARWDASGAAIQLEDLGNTQGVAFDINEAGIAVGASRVYDGASITFQRAVYWNLDGSVVDLNSLIDPASGWTLKAATDISDSGWIFGLGDFDPDGTGGQAAYARMFIMQVPTTIPEPAAGALALLGVNSSILLLRRRSLWRPNTFPGGPGGFRARKQIMRSNTCAFLAILLCTSAAARASAAASLTPLGDLPGGGGINSIANGVSGDGSVVVGIAGGYGGQAYRWTAAGGMVGLGRPPGDFYSYARAVNGDGSVVVGGSQYADVQSEIDRTQAARWTAAGGMQGLGHLPGGGAISVALGVSGDGSVIVGASDSASGHEAFRWTASGGMQGLGDLPGGGFQSEANGVSADGSVIVGFGYSASDYEAFRWTSAGGMVGLGFLPGDLNSQAYGVSADGSIVVGTSSSMSGVHLFRWTSADGMVGLGNLPGGFNPMGFSADGSVVVGYEVQYDISLSPHYTALYWTADGGVRALWDVLLSHGVDPAADGWSRLEFAKALSADGNTIVGDGIRNGNQEAFVAVIPTIVPEPAAGALALLGASSILLLRRRSLGRPNKVSLSKDEPCD